MEFKVGDIVERINSDNAYMRIGDVGIIILLHHDLALIKEFSEWQKIINLKLVKTITRILENYEIY